MYGMWLRRVETIEQGMERKKHTYVRETKLAHLRLISFEDIESNERIRVRRAAAEEKLVSLFRSSFRI